MPAPKKRVRYVTSFNLDAATEANLKTISAFYEQLRLRMTDGAAIRRALAHLAAHTRDLNGTDRPDLLLIEKAVASGYARLGEVA